MRVDLELADGSKACGVFIHKKLSDSAGYERLSLPLAYHCHNPLLGERQLAQELVRLVVPVSHTK